jgi:hypothetical protein
LQKQGKTPQKIDLLNKTILDCKPVLSSNPGVLSFLKVSSAPCSILKRERGKIMGNKGAFCVYKVKAAKGERKG